MKIKFNVSKIFNMTNSKTEEAFVKLQLVKVVNKEINGCMTVARLVAYHNVQSTKLEVGDEFMFDDINYEMVKQQYADESGVVKQQNIIYLKAE